MTAKLIVIGGGAAGFFCAVNAARLCPSLKVHILEKQSNVLQKVKVSGGGRCNLTHNTSSPADLLNQYPRGKRFLKKAFSLFSPIDTVQWFTERGVQIKSEPDGRMFPVSDQSQSVIDCLLHEAGRYQVELSLRSEVTRIEKTKTGFQLYLHNGQTLDTNFLFVATGGFQKSEHYQWLQALGHQIAKPVPSLFTFNIPQTDLTSLMGVVANNAWVKIEGSKLHEQGPVLITHWGLSGPAILRLSAWGAVELAAMNYHFRVIVNWMGIPESELREQWNSIRIAQGAQVLGNKNPFGLPLRLWDY